MQFEYWTQCIRPAACILSERPTGARVQDVHRQASASGQLLAPINAEDITKAARSQKGIELSPMLLELDPSMVSLGTYQVPLRCFVAEGVKAIVDINVLNPKSVQ